ncbi:MAG: hypothetical protein DWQ37_02365 [Planctomycetota bacterium]|nr:MAG: hypothetical protein DWQ37_02365 [Planctomycetota bacterium]
MIAHLPVSLACRAAALPVLACLFLSAPLLGAEPDDLEALVAATKSSSEATSLEAIGKLGQQGAAAVPALESLLQSDSPRVRAYALRALGEIGPEAKGAADSVIPLFSDPDPLVRRQVIEALKGIRPGPKVAVPLFVKLMQDSDPGVRLRVMSAVADAGGNAVPALVEALKNPDATYWACLILRDIGPEAAPAVPALKAALEDRRPEVRREATLALATIGSPEAVEALVPMLKDEHARTAATFALGTIGKIPPQAQSTVRANAQSSDGLLSTVSLWALARANPDDEALLKEAGTRLVERLKDDDPFVRAGAARALSALPPNPKIAGPIFEKALADADEKTTHYLLDAVAGMGPPAVPKLIGALEHKALRGPIAAILGRIGPPAAPATSALADLLQDEDPNVSTEAAYALAKIGPGAKAAVPALAAALANPDEGPAHGAAFALGQIGPAAAAAEPALVQAMAKDDNSLTLLCAWALVQIKGKSPETAAEVLPELLAGLESPLPKSRQMAAETLGSLGPAAKDALAQLKTATEDPDASVRDAAEHAIASIRG